MLFNIFLTFCDEDDIFTDSTPQCPYIMTVIPVIALLSIISDLCHPPALLLPPAQYPVLRIQTFLSSLFSPLKWNSCPAYTLTVYVC